MTDFETNPGSSNANGTGGQGSSLRWLSLMLRFALVLMILGVGVAISAYLLMNKPKPEKKRPSSEATLVEVAAVTVANEPIVVKAMGTVVAAREVQLAAQVGGAIVRIDRATDVSPDFVPGGRVARGQTLLQIDQRDFVLVVQQRASDLARAEADLRLELGQQSVAQREYELLGEAVVAEDRELVLRQPQLGIAKAAVATARAALDKAKLDLERTTVQAPFNAVVQARHVDFGSQVSPGSPLATLVGTDEYWIEVTVPLSRLRWLNIPGAADSVRIYHESAWGEKVSRTGRVVRQMADLEPQGRMARLLVSVADPLALTEASTSAGLPALALGAYVRVEIEGRELANVVRLPRTALRDGDRVWVMTSEKTLEVRQVAIAWTGGDHVCVSGGLTAGDQLVTSDLAAPVEGMLLRTAADKASEKDADTPSGESGETTSEADKPAETSGDKAPMADNGDATKGVQE